MLQKILGKGLILGLCGGLLLPAHIVSAAEEGKPSDLEALILLLKEKHIVSDEEAARFIDKLQATATQEKKPEKTITIMPRGQMYMKQLTDTVAADIKDKVAEQVKYEIKDDVVRELKLGENTGPVPSWTQRISLSGDVRLREQQDMFDDQNGLLQNPADATSLLNTRVDRERQRMRVRLGLKAEVNDQVEVGIRLAGGTEKDPVSTNDTLGDYYNKDGFLLDQAFVRWLPLPEVSLVGGRVPNPFFSSDLVWDGDLNFEGVAVHGKMPLAGIWRGFATLGYFPLQDIELTEDDKYLVGGQAGIEYEPRPDILGKFGVAYYDYHHVAGIPNSASSPGLYDYSLPAFQQWGNDYFDINSFVGTPGTPVKYGLAPDFKLLNLTMSFDLALFKPVVISFVADFVTNLGFDHDEILDRTGISYDDETDGYQVGLGVGYPRVTRLGEWKSFVTYRYIEKNAVLDAFTDSDFHLGGTNAKGWIIGTDIGVYDNFWLTARWLSSDVISGVPYSVDTLQFDLNTRF